MADGKFKFDKAVHGGGMLRALCDEMAHSDGWHMGLRLKDGTTMELAVFDAGGTEGFAILDSGEIPGRPFGGRLFVSESAVAMAWATEDPAVIAPAVTPAGPREAFFAPRDAEYGRPAPPALEPTKCAWPTIAPLGSRWLDAAVHEHRIWVRGNGDGEWTATGSGRLGDPSYQVSELPYVEVEGGADGWAIPPGWEGSDLAVAPSFAPSAEGWPAVVRWGDLSDQEVNDAVCGCVLRATRYSPVNSAIIYPAAWADSVAELLQARQASFSSRFAAGAPAGPEAPPGSDPYAGGLEEWQSLEMLLALPTLRWEAELNAPRLRELLRRAAARLRLLRARR
jgi:hypothetical protein